MRAGNAPSSGIGSMNHLAFQVEDKKMLRRVKKQLRLAAEQGALARMRSVGVTT